MPALTRYVRDNVLGFIAIFIALSAGAYAIDVAPRNSVVSKSVRNGAIKRVDLARNSVDGSKVINGSLTGADIDEASLAIEGDGNSGGTVTSITAGAGLDGGTIANQGTIALHKCPASQLLKSTGGGYGCAEDSETATTYTADAARGVELDGTTFGLKSCPDGQLLKSAGAGAYGCAADIDTDTQYAGNLANGIELDGTTFSLKACPDGQLLKSAGAGAYGCAADIDTDTQYAGNLAKGIELDGTSFGLKPCAAGLLLKSAGAGAYNCAGDIDTNTTYSAGTGLQLSGTQFSIASGGVGGAQVADGSLSAADLGFVRAVNFSASAPANGQCASAIQSQTAQFAPGQEGDFTLMSSSPAVPLNFVLAGRVGPINGGFREYYFSVCNLTGSTANMPATTVRMLVIAQ